jgi:Zn-finger nucleic acid-binding protein
MSAYRAQLRICPACASPMDAVPLSGDANDATVKAEADACAKCGGIFLEFFDGEPAAISRAMVGRDELHRSGGAQAGELRCPDCACAMVRKAYLGVGPELARCEQCLAVFLAPDEVALLANLALPPEQTTAEPTWLSRLLGWLPGMSSTR